MDVRMDHVVIWVEDPIRSLDFYERIVGLPGERVVEFTTGKAPFPSVRVSADSIIDLMPRARADNGGNPVNHVCLAMSQADFEALRSRLEENGVDIPVTMEGSFGARGLAPHTFYFRDPDENVLEARHY